MNSPAPPLTAWILPAVTPAGTGFTDWNNELLPDLSKGRAGSGGGAQACLPDRVLPFSLGLTHTVQPDLALHCLESPMTSPFGAGACPARLCPLFSSCSKDLRNGYWNQNENKRNPESWDILALCFERLRRASLEDSSDNHPRIALDTY